MARLDVLEWLLDKVRPTERLEVKVTGGDAVDRLASVMEGARCPVVTLSVDIEYTMDDGMYAEIVGKLDKLKIHSL
jgi:hypothetical protein